MFDFGYWHRVFSGDLFHPRRLLDHLVFENRGEFVQLCGQVLGANLLHVLVRVSPDLSSVRVNVEVLLRDFAFEGLPRRELNLFLLQRHREVAYLL